MHQHIVPVLFYLSLPFVVQGKLISCVCTTEPCIEQQTTTCNTTSMCFSQYLDRGDGNNPIVKGCITSKTPLLCENRRPAVHHSNWPVLLCCNKNMCNQDVVPTPAGGLGKDLTGKSTSTVSTSSADDVSTELKTNVLTDGSGDGKTTHVLSSVYVLVLIAGVCSLLVIGGIAVIVLRRQTSLYDQEFGPVQRNGYMKGQTTDISSSEIHSSQPKILTRTYDNKLVLNT